MKRFFIHFACAGAAAATAVAARAATLDQIQAFAPYQAIIDRQPFGTPPPASAVTAPTPDQIEAAKKEEELARKIGMCAVNITPGGVKVGFIDNSANPPKSYYLAVGDTSDGFTLVDASYGDETATLEKDDVTITLKLGQGLVDQTPKDNEKNAADRGRPGRLRPPRASAAEAGSEPAVNGASGSTDGDGQMSYSERLRNRREEERRKRMERAREMREQVERAAEEKAAEAEDRVRHEINMELIRRGQEGLGVELTPAEEDELVEDGILEPQ